MTKEDFDRETAAWLKERPECVQALAREFPVNISVEIGGALLYLIGYTEDDKLILSDVNPCLDYEQAIEQRQYLCASHLRDALAGKKPERLCFSCGHQSGEPVRENRYVQIKEVPPEFWS